MAEIRVRKGVVYAEIGDVHREMLMKMVEESHSDQTKFIRLLVEEEWKRRGHAPLVDVIGEGVGEPVPVYGVR